MVSAVDSLVGREFPLTKIKFWYYIQGSVLLFWAFVLLRPFGSLHFDPVPSFLPAYPPHCFTGLAALHDSLFCDLSCSFAPIPHPNYILKLTYHLPHPSPYLLWSIIPTIFPHYFRHCFFLLHHLLYTPLPQLLPLPYYSLTLTTSLTTLLPCVFYSFILTIPLF